MAKPGEVLGVVLAVKFVVMSAIVLLLVPISAAAPLIPVFLLLLFVLYRYWS